MASQSREPMQLLQHFPPKFFKLYLLFWFFFGTPHHWRDMSAGLFSVLGRALFTLLQRRGWLCLALSSPWYLYPSWCLCVADWFCSVTFKSLISAFLNSLCSACRMHSLNFFFCQPILNMLTNPSLGGKPWESYSWCFPSKKNLKILLSLLSLKLWDQGCYFMLHCFTSFL